MENIYITLFIVSNIRALRAINVLLMQYVYVVVSLVGFVVTTHEICKNMANV